MVNGQSLWEGKGGWSLENTRIDWPRLELIDGEKPGARAMQQDGIRTSRISPFGGSPGGY